MAQFSVKQLMMIVALAGIACIALARADVFWASGVFLVTVTALLIAVAASVVCRGQSQAFWIGVAILGWGYLWVAHWPNQHYGSSQRHWKLETNSQGNLITTQLLRSLYPPERGTGGLTRQYYFVATGHSLFTLVFAFLGGLLTRHLHSQRDGP